MRRYRVTARVAGQEIDWRHWTRSGAIERAVRLARIGAVPGPVVTITDGRNRKILQIQQIESGWLKSAAIDA